MFLINKLFTRGYRTSKFAQLTVPQELHDVIIGLMLGDLHAEKPSAKANTRLSFKGGLINAPYILHLFGLFSNFTISNYTTGESKLGIKGHSKYGKLYGYIKFNTVSIIAFNIYRSMFYNSSGVKYIPHNIGVLLSPRGLAY